MVCVTQCGCTFELPLQLGLELPSQPALRPHMCSLVLRVACGSHTVAFAKAGQLAGRDGLVYCGRMLFGLVRLGGLAGDGAALSCIVSGGFKTACICLRPAFYSGLCMEHNPAASRVM